MELIRQNDVHTSTVVSNSIQNGPTLEFVEKLKLSVSCTMDNITHILAVCKSVSL